MRKQIEILRADLQPGDLTLVSNPGNSWIMVEREFPEPEPEPSPEPGYGTAIVHGKRVRGYIDADGDFGHLNQFGHNTYSAYTDFVPDSDEKPEPTKPQITRELFIRTLRQTAVDNNLDTVPGFDTAIVFAADRLGLY